MPERADDALEEVVLRVAVGRPAVEVAHLAALLREVVLEHLQRQTRRLTPQAPETRSRLQLRTDSPCAPMTMSPG